MVFVVMFLSCVANVRSAIYDANRSFEIRNRISSNTNTQRENSTKDHDADIIVLGAGAAGLMAAIEAGRSGRRVLVLEHNRVPARKILISGGGKCNFTNLHLRPECFLSDNPPFCISALRRFTEQDMLRMVEAGGIPWEERDHGQLFCRRSAKDLVEMLLRECAQHEVRIETGIRVSGLDKADAFRVHCADRDRLSSAVIVATGGLSIPSLGATDTGFTIASHFGIPVIPPRPGLTPLLWNREDGRRFGGLAGISLPVQVAIDAMKFEDALLFTHHGISGPAILQMSSYWRPGREIQIDFLPNSDLHGVMQENTGRKTCLGLVKDFLPHRLAEVLTPAGLAPRVLKQCGIMDRTLLASAIHQCRVVPAGLVGFDKAEVTCGGIDTRALSSQSMEVKDVPGLFFIGEVTDVTGWLGGYNFQWAWSSGVAAGQRASTISG